MGRASSSVKDEIRQRINLVDLVSAQVALKKAGRQFRGLCPFHQEKTPSFHVDPDRGLFFCFGCHAGGDAFDFIMRVGNLSFAEALEHLAERAGVALTRTPEEEREHSEQQQILRALAAAAAFYREQLAGPAGKIARDYLRGRGLDPQTVERFGLGYAPAAWDGLLAALRAQGYLAAVLERAGLVAARAQGDGHYDVFRHRLVFPIQDLQDRTVGFGGRALDDATPKYLNSRESPAFNKGRLLYALNVARESVRERGEVIVVEGYTDALACHQHGFANTVATLGTALTADHVQVLKRFAPRAVVVYDSDAAGMLASERGLYVFEEAEMAVRVAVLPDGRDPDSFVRRDGPEAFRTIIESSLSMFDYRLVQAVRRHDPRGIEGRVALADEVLPVIGSVSNPVRQAEYLRVLAERFGLSEDALRQRLAARNRAGRPGVLQPQPPLLPPATARQKAEEWLVHAMVQAPEIRGEIRRDLSVEEFLDPLLCRVAAALLADDEPAEAARERLADDERAVALLTRLLFEPLEVGEKDREREIQRVMTSYSAYLRRERGEAERRRLFAAIRDAQAAGDEGEVVRLQSAILRAVGAEADQTSGRGGEDDG